MRLGSEEKNRRRGPESGTRLAAGIVPVQLQDLCIREKGVGETQQRWKGEGGVEKEGDRRGGGGKGRKKSIPSVV